MSLTLTSPLFAADAPLPTRSACDGENLSPPLRWVDVPDGTRELALLVEDPDAPHGPFVHWVVAGIDPSIGALTEGEAPPRAVVGANGAGDRAWTGPCPPPGDPPHRYVFTLVALSETSDFAPGGSADDLRAAVAGKVVARAELVARYAR